MFEPPDADGKNVKCIVERKLPAVGALPARTLVCGARFKYASGDRGAGVWGTGTSGFFNHLKQHHPVAYATAHQLGRGSNESKRTKGVILAGEVQTAVHTRQKNKSCTPNDTSSNILAIILLLLVVTAVSRYTIYTLYMLYSSSVYI